MYHPKKFEIVSWFIRMVTKIHIGDCGPHPKNAWSKSPSGPTCGTTGITSPMKPDWNFTVGMRVKYAARFLRSICDYSVDSANRVGTIVEIKEFGGKCPAIA